MPAGGAGTINEDFKEATKINIRRKKSKERNKELRTRLFYVVKHTP